jgi:DNA ligase-1
MRLEHLVAASADVAATPARTQKIARLAGVIAGAGVEEIEAVVAFLSGELVQRQIGVGWASLRALPRPAAASTLTVREVDDAFASVGGVSGAGSQAERRRRLDALFTRATEQEQRYLVRLVGGELRQGAQEGVMIDAIARACGVGAASVRRAHMLRGDLGAVARTARTEGEAGLSAVGLEVGRPVHPMLAQTESDVGEALDRLGDGAVEWKLDGVRIQIHKAGGDVAVFTRTLDDITARVPEVVEAARALPARAAVLDGELIALRADGRPERFQVTARRVGSRDAAAGKATPLTPFVFDALHLDGEDLIDRPGGERVAVIAEVAQPELLVPRLVRPTPEAAHAFVADTLARGHEGVMVKSLDAPYEAGRRGAGWLKVKPVHVLDLVVLAAEWGHGRRQGRLSNLHLGAREPGSGQFVMLGKTFKGLTDAMLEWQTARLLELETGRDGIVVHVRPELVVEVAFDGVQTSRRYPAGLALRFARVRRHRPDKPASEADTVETVRAIHDGMSPRVGDLT